MKAKRKTDNNMKSQQEATTKVKRPQFTSNFTQDNKLFYLYLDLIRK